jgi:hypothetical protein
MTVSNIVVDIKPRFNIYLSYLIVWARLPAKWAFSVSKPRWVKK